MMRPLKRFDVLMVGLLCEGLAAQGQTGVVNGDFSEGLTPGWTVRGDHNVVRTFREGSDPEFAFVLFSEPGDPSEPGEQEPGHVPTGNQLATAAIWQDFTIQADPEVFAFRFRFTHGISATPPVKDPAISPDTRPPDSFTVWLGEQGNAISRLVGGPPSASAPPEFSEAILYVDSNGAMIYDASLIQVADKPDRDGMLGVMLDLTSLGSTPTDARVMFSFASADNGVWSFAALDDVQTACPPTYCCDPPTDKLALLDDGNPCTTDTCENGEPDHDDVDCANCAECSNSAASIAIMIDRTASTSNTDLENEKEAAAALLDFFAGASVRPSVAVGTFNGPCTGTPPSCSGGGGAQDPAMSNNARMLGDGQPTNQYGMNDETNPTGLYALIDDITLGPNNGYTDIAAAISVAADHLPARTNPETDPPNYIIVISDGWTNIKADGSSPCTSGEGGVCGCDDARDAASAAADAAESEPTYATIAAVHYIGSGGGNCQDNQDRVDEAIALMQGEIATTQDYYFEGSDFSDPDFASNLLCAFYDVIQVISCDDGDPDTPDCCILDQCAHGDDCPQP